MIESQRRRVRVGWRSSFAVSMAIAAVAVAGPSVSRACDLCAVYQATQMGQRQTGPRLGLAEQFTRFGTLQDNGDEVPNPAGEYLNSSIMQLLVGYQFLPWVGAQVNVPVIIRDYRRLEDTGIEKGTASGFGDVSLIADVMPYHWTGENALFSASLFGGLKLPSGDADLLKEETEEDGHGGEPEEGVEDEHLAFHGTGDESELSGIHGHDLALGSGSVDGIIGGRVFGSWKRFYFSAALQYLLRTEGAFDYRYANDLIWRGGPGAFVLTDHKLGSEMYSLRAGAVLSGETKGKDRLDGSSVDDTGITSLYAGPGFVFTWGTSLVADIEADLPLILNNTNLQIVPDYRIRGGIVWRF